MCSSKSITARRDPATACYLKVNDGMNVVTTPKRSRSQDGVLDSSSPITRSTARSVTRRRVPAPDQTLAHGSGETRFIEEKRHFVSPSRSARSSCWTESGDPMRALHRGSPRRGGDAQIAFAGRGDSSRWRLRDPALRLGLLGNTVQICPVGALTAKPIASMRDRGTWNRSRAPARVCRGLSLAVQSSGNRLTRVLGVDSEPVNHGWLCDKVASRSSRSTATKCRTIR